MQNRSGEAPAAPCLNNRKLAATVPGTLYDSLMSEYRSPGRTPSRLRLVVFLPVLLLVVTFVTACGASGPGANSTAAREVALRQIAQEYAENGDLEQATGALEKLKLANAGQLLVTLAEADLAAGRAREDIEATAALAAMLGARSQKLVAYLSPTPIPVQAPVQAATLAPVQVTVILPTATEAPLPTAVPPTATAVPEPPAATPEPTPGQAVTNSPTPPPQPARVVADGNVNLRSGPGRAYPVIGALRGGQETAIVARNENGDWWQVEGSNGALAWVAGTVVRVLGAIDAVSVAQNIPAPPTAAPRPTAAPQPTAAPVAVAPAGPHFALTVRRLWTVEETGGFLAGGLSVNCGFQHNLHVYVRDAAGNLLNGVTIREAGGVQQELVSGSKGSGMVEFDLYPPGKDVYVIRDVDGRQATSDTAAAPTVPQAISFDVLRGAHFCRDDADCTHFVSQNGCYGHYSWDVEFRRNY